MGKYIALGVVLLLCISGGNAGSFQTEQQSGGITLLDVRLGRDVKERAIVDEDSVFEVDAKAFLWMKIEGAASDSITVTWSQADYSHETKLFVGGNPWRTWATKTLTRKGEWTVSVAGPDGSVLKQLEFKVR
jgi:hypothetical protein